MSETKEKLSRVLTDLANQLNNLNINWLLGASGALMVWGVNIEPQDLDIFVSQNDVKRLEPIFQRSIVNPIHEFDKNGKKFLEFQMKIDGVNIEILELNFSSEDLEKVNFKGILIPVNPLKKELEHYRKRVGTKDRVPLIEKRLLDIDNEKVMLSKAKKTIKKGNKFIQPHLIVLMGLPGSGKSYVSGHLHNKYDYTILSSENITFSLFGTEKVTGSGYTFANKILRQLSIDLIKEGYTVVIDGTNLKYEYRKQIYEEVNIKSVILIYIVIEDLIAIDRITQRGEDSSDQTNIKSVISQKTFDNFKNQLEEPLENEKYFKINSDKDLLIRVDKIIENL